MSGVPAFLMYNKQNMEKKKNKLKHGINKKFKSSKMKLAMKDRRIIKSKFKIKNKSKITVSENVFNSKEETFATTSTLTAPITRSTLDIENENENEFHKKPSQLLEAIIYPLSLQEFFENNWEKSPLYIKRNCINYYQDLLTTEKIDKILRKNLLYYTRNVDVVSYVNGKRETHNPEGRAIAAALWDNYDNGCSIRILNPHTYCSKLHSLLASFQEFFGCMAGANAYLTPPNSQGFAPHYDDIEAFILQLEGRKHWKLYAPLTKSEVLPRTSSRDFDRERLKNAKLMKEITLEAGDLLYFPRGTIHEGLTDSDAHSLHVTISVYQKNSYADLLEHTLLPALQRAADEDVKFRKGLPIQYLQHIGTVNSKSSSDTRKDIMNTIDKLFSCLKKHINIDAGADELGKQFMWDSMPPFPSTQEQLCMVHENSDKIADGKTFNKVEIDLKVEVRLFRYHCLHVVDSDAQNNTIKIYYNTENAKSYHGEEQQFLDMDKEFLPIIKFLIHRYPEFVKVDELPLDNVLIKMQLVSDLWEKGLLVTKRPLS